MSTERAKILLAKAANDLKLSKDHLHDDDLRDNVGYLIAQASEKTMKAICELGGIEYDRGGEKGHCLETLYYSIFDHKVGFIAEYRDLLELQIFDSQSRYCFTEEENRVKLSPLWDLSQALFLNVLRRLDKKGLI